MKRRSPPPPWLKAARTQDKSPSSKPLDWLSRALTRAGVLPKDDAERAIRDGRVQVNGRVQLQPFAEVSAADHVRLDGHPIALAAPVLAAMLNKPKGVVSAPTDPENVGTIFEVFQRAIPLELARFGWHAIGRLDRNTTGLLLFTNDERLVAHVTSPQTNLTKRYLATVSGKVTEAKLRPLREGIILDDGPALPAEAELLPSGQVALTLTEGRHHQAKRMLGAVGLPVLELHREAIGTLEVDVAEGAVRLLDETEIRVKLRYDGTGRHFP